MAHQATSAAPGAVARGRARLGALAGSEPVRTALGFALVSRLVVAAVACYAALAAEGEARFVAQAERFDAPALTAPLGGLGDLLLTPLARWDAAWFLSIAADGYESADSPRTAFFPLYPLLARGLGELGGGGPGATLVAAYLVSVAAFAGALLLLWKLTALELGRRFAAPALLLLCAFPASLFFGAPYSESLFLLASVGAFYAARTGRWAWAGVATAGATGTRSAGILLLLPLAILYLYGPRADRDAVAPAGHRGWWASLRPVHRVRAEIGWLALAPGGLIAFAAYLGIEHGDAVAFASVQGDVWNREWAGPLAGAWEGAVGAWDGVRQLASGSRETVFFERAGGDPFRVASINLVLFGFLVFAAIGTVGVLRRLPFAYGAYVVAALMLPLSYPVGVQPLMSLPRFVAVLFPLFMWLALVCTQRRSTERVAAFSAVLLGLFTAQFAGWNWIA